MPIWILPFETDLELNELGAWHIDIQFEWIFALLYVDSTVQSCYFYFIGGQH